MLGASGFRCDEFLEFIPVRENETKFHLFLCLTCQDKYEYSGDGIKKHLEDVHCVEFDKPILRKKDGWYHIDADGWCQDNQRWNINDVPGLYVLDCQRFKRNVPWGCPNIDREWLEKKSKEALELYAASKGIRIEMA